MSNAKAQTLDFFRRRFNTYGDEVIISSATTGLPINITGYSFVMYVYTTETPEDRLTAIYTVAGSLVDAVAGRVEFAPTLSQATQPDGTLFHEVVMVDGALRERTVAIGKYTYY